MRALLTTDAKRRDEAADVPVRRERPSWFTVSRSMLLP